MTIGPSIEIHRFAPLDSRRTRSLLTMSRRGIAGRSRYRIRVVRLTETTPEPGIASTVSTNEYFAGSPDWVAVRAVYERKKHRTPSGRLGLTHSSSSPPNERDVHARHSRKAPGVRQHQLTDLGIVRHGHDGRKVRARIPSSAGIGAVHIEDGERQGIRDVQGRSVFERVQEIRFVECPAIGGNQAHIFDVDIEKIRVRARRLAEKEGDGSD